MEETTVLIVGAGPSGLAAGLALAKHKIRSVILEKEKEIDYDPRGVYLNGDAVRILYDLGLEEWDAIGHEPIAMNFHRSSFKNSPFYVMDMSGDFLGQAVPNGFTHIQPKLEAALASLIDRSEYCTLRRGCTVTKRQTDSSSTTITYTNTTGSESTITTRWLLAADGKKGTVRKHFLEPTVGITQQFSDYRYDGTWVAANLRIHLPTPATHPNLPFWSLGMTPEEVYVLFWPRDWHFCTPPGKPTACGRFGPLTDRLWRHEFAEHGWDDSMNSVELLWEHLEPMITYDRDREGRRFEGGAVTYPRDCIEVLRCRPFKFTHKVVNRWFHGRTILVGDAAHVFPPFGGEGIASGVRDVHQLAWRIALAERAALDDGAIDHLLTAWTEERRKGIKNAVDFTKLNGTLCNEPESWGFWMFRNMEAVLKMTPFVPSLPNPRSFVEAKGWRGVRGGWFLPEFDGGGKLAQIFVRGDLHGIWRSDHTLEHEDSLLTIFVMETGNVREAQDAIQSVELPPGLLSLEGVVSFVNQGTNGIPRELPELIKVIQPATPSKAETPAGYRPEVFRDRLRKSSYAIVRPDFYIVALLASPEELRQALHSIREMTFAPHAGEESTRASKL